MDVNDVIVNKMTARMDKMDRWIDGWMDGIEYVDGWEEWMMDG